MSPRNRRPRPLSLPPRFYVVVVVASVTATTPAAARSRSASAPIRTVSRCARLLFVVPASTTTALAAAEFPSSSGSIKIASRCSPPTLRWQVSAPADQVPLWPPRTAPVPLSSIGFLLSCLLALPTRVRAALGIRVVVELQRGVERGRFCPRFLFCPSPADRSGLRAFERNPQA